MLEVGLSGEAEGCTQNRVRSKSEEGVGAVELTLQVVKSMNKFDGPLAHGRVGSSLFSSFMAIFLSIFRFMFHDSCFMCQASAI